ncbi:MAG TPA: IS1182 family transposase [Burkholderiales bacterium]
MVSREGLFENLPEQVAAQGEGRSRPRLRRPVRDQVELRAVDLDSLIAGEDPVRVIWAYVERLELDALYEPIKAREDTPGHPPIDPRLLLALWLYACSQGVGSARALARLCGSHDTYRWLCGGVSVNYHTLSDFRTAHPALLEELLTQNVAALLAAGVIDLEQLAQDGVRIRAGAGAASYRRRATLERHLDDARALVARLRRELDDDPEASSRRQRAARERAAREREARVEQALTRMAELEAERKRREKTNKKEVDKQAEPRASTTDAETRVMKMADGGFRPAYNVQLASAAQAQVIVGVDIDTSGSDRGLLRPMLNQIERRYGVAPARYLADGGFTKNEDLDWAFDPDHGGTRIYAPAVTNKHGTDPYAPRPKDRPGVADWRRRMGSEDGQAVYRERTPAECINARARQWNLRQFTVRGRRKVGCIVRLFALANNILQGHRLMRLAAAA